MPHFRIQQLFFSQLRVPDFGTVGYSKKTQKGDSSGGMYFNRILIHTGKQGKTERDHFFQSVKNQVI